MQTLAPVESLFKTRIECIADLPVLPQVHMQAMSIATDPNGNAYQLQEVLRHDPALTAMILKVANSAYYGFSRKIETLRTALVMLGTSEIIRLVSTTALISTFKENKLHSKFDFYKFWEHSVAVAEVSSHFSKELNLPVSGDVYTGGLLHDVGSLLLASYFQPEYEMAYDLAEERSLSMREAEDFTLGIDHASVGSLLAQQWNLPDSLSTIVRNHHDPTKAKSHFLAISIVYLANRICNHKELRQFPGNTERPVEFDPAWRVLASRILPQKMDVREMISSTEPVLDRAKEFISSMLSN